MYAAMNCGEMLAVSVFLFVGVSARSALFPETRYNADYVQNSLSPIALAGRERPNYINVTRNLTEKIIIVPQGQRVELECLASGSPAPSIEWFKGYRLISPESNDINGIAEIGSIVSKYVIECAQPVHQGMYTCKGSSGDATSEIETALIVQVTIPSLFSTCKAAERKPTIVTSRPSVFQLMGSDVLLPCTAHGRPKPKVFWKDEDDNVIENGRDARFKVLPSGDLLILSIRWSDMGLYFCVAENKEGNDTAKTFLYPYKNEK